MKIPLETNTNIINSVSLRGAEQRSNPLSSLEIASVAFGNLAMTGGEGLAMTT